MFKFLKSMMWYIKPNWWRYVIVVIFGVLNGLVNLLPATIIARLTTAIESNTLTEHILIYEVFLPFLGSVTLIYLCATFMRLSQNRLTTSLYYALHKRYMESIMIQDAYFFEKFKAGDLLTRALGDINQVKFSGGNRLLKIFCESITITITFVALILIHPILAVCCFVPLTLIFISNLLLKRIVKKNWAEVRKKHSDMGNKVLESITNVRTIRAFSKEEEDYEENIKYSNQAYIVEKKNLRVNVIFQPLFQFIVGISTVICYALGAYFYYLSEITIAQLVQFVMYLNLFQQPLTAIGNLVNNFYQSMISAERLNEVYDSKSSVIDKVNAKDASGLELLEFKDFSFKYQGDTFYSLKDINLKIEKGKTLGIVGKTGSGKSTLVRQLVRQLPIDADTLYLNEMPIDNYHKESVRKIVSYVPQEHVLFSRSVYDNVKLGKKDASDDEIHEAIKLADFEKDLDNLPYGLDTIVGEYGVTLSGGQKQRLAIARAFLKNSDILILDDSLSAVDGKTEANIIDTLNDYRKNKTNIIVAHRLSAVMQADNIIVLDKGKIVESGTHRELMRNKGWYYTQFKNQQMNKEGE
ncbi:MAG: ABC transporter ATP-binding protein [Acholeplasmatales bacterium]|nr:ABC transporter ATP-binding protein [Acholeplasmatales bacterium]